MTRASPRWTPGLSGFGSGPTALTNARRPSASRSRVATPGENPPGCVTASATLPPSRASTSSRSQSGASAHANRRPVAGGTGRFPLLLRVHQRSVSIPHARGAWGHLPARHPS